MARPKTSKDKSGGRKSEVITIRLDPRLKYLAELAARRQRRPLSSYVEWAIEQSLEQIYLSYANSAEEPTALSSLASSLWDVDESDRFANLAFKYPELLTHEEQVVWKLIRECQAVWRSSIEQGEWVWRVDSESLVRDALRKHFDTFQKVARGEAPLAKLPQATFRDPPDTDEKNPF